MLDPDEVHAYEAWKEHKITTAQDVSPEAYNVEMESQALAYEQGVKDVFKELGDDGADSAGIAKLQEFLDENPYRAAGMRGFRKPKVNPRDIPDGDGNVFGGGADYHEDPDFAPPFAPPSGK